MGDNLLDLHKGFWTDQGPHDGKHELQPGRWPDEDDKLHILSEGIAHLPVAGCQPAWRDLVLHAGTGVEKDQHVWSLHGTDLSSSSYAQVTDDESFSGDTSVRLAQHIDPLAGASL